MIVIMLNHKHFSEYFFLLTRSMPTVNFLHRARCFRENNSVLSPEDFEIRKKYFIEKLNSTEFHAKSPSENNDNDPLAAFNDPSSNEALMQMAKGNLMNYIPQTLIMGWVNYFLLDLSL